MRGKALTDSSIYKTVDQLPEEPADRGTLKLQGLPLCVFQGTKPPLTEHHYNAM